MNCYEYNVTGFHLLNDSSYGVNAENKQIHESFIYTWIFSKKNVFLMYYMIIVSLVS